MSRKLKVGTLIDKYFKQKQVADLASTELDKQKAKLSDIGDQVYSAMKEQKLETSGGTLGTVKEVVVEFFTPKNWPKIHEYVLKHDAFELFQKRLSKTAVIEHLEANGKIPGVIKTKVRQLKFTKSKGEKK